MPLVPSAIKLHKKSQRLEVTFESNTFLLSAEYLRVHSPSAEVKGHGPGQAVLQYSKKHVAITGIEAQGNYAIKLIFDDGHDTGLYTWSYLFELGSQEESKWAEYCDKLDKAGLSRDPSISTVKFISP